MNQAQQLLTRIGVACVSDAKTAHGNKNGKATKAGPGRFHKPNDGDPNKRTRAYVALMAAWASKRVTKEKRRDQHGALTFTGRDYFPDGTQRRRIWLAGISAQRGY